MGNIEFERDKKSIIAKLPERLDISNSGEVLKELEVQVKNAKFKEFIFDMEKCTFISSAGIGLIVNITRQVKERDCKTKIINYSDQIKEIFEITDVLSYVGT